MLTIYDIANCYSELMDYTIVLALTERGGVRVHGVLHACELNIVRG
jgi:hypothetical protein